MSSKLQEVDVRPSLAKDKTTSLYTLGIDYPTRKSILYFFCPLEKLLKKGNKFKECIFVT